MSREWASPKTLLRAASEAQKPAPRARVAYDAVHANASSHVEVAARLLALCASKTPSLCLSCPVPRVARVRGQRHRQRWRLRRRHLHRRHHFLDHIEHGAGRFHLLHRTWSVHPRAPRLLLLVPGARARIAHGHQRGQGRRLRRIRVSRAHALPRVRSAAQPQPLCLLQRGHVRRGRHSKGASQRVRVRQRLPTSQHGRVLRALPWRLQQPRRDALRRYLHAHGLDVRAGRCVLQVPASISPDGAPVLRRRRPLCCQRPVRAATRGGAREGKRERRTVGEGMPPTGRARGFAACARPGPPSVLVALRAPALAGGRLRSSAMLAHAPARRP